MTESTLRTEETESTLRPEDLAVEWVFPAAPDFKTIDQDPIQGGDPASGVIRYAGNGKWI